LDKKTNKEVAIKIIKSKKPFLMQARTEIELLTLLNDNDREDQHNIGTSDCVHCLLVALFSTTMRILRASCTPFVATNAFVTCRASYLSP
jgi:hypothetical protein